ncbi:hypothetical protein [Streptomyces sp. NPDC059805]|uniref:hypothetical protein n=1 Tax=Streptomyces sp. NPDC059805 TaxID=3346954 RepID=UPI00364B932F
MSTVSDVLESYARDWSIDATPLISPERKPSDVTARSIPTEDIRDDFACFLEALVTPWGTQERQSKARSLLAEIVARRLTPSEQSSRTRNEWTYGTAEVHALIRREIERRITPPEPQAIQPPADSNNRALDAVNDLASWLGVTGAKAADLAGGYRRSYYNWLKGAIPYGAPTLNLFEAHAFVATLVDAIETRGAREWFNMPYASGTRLDLLCSPEGRATLSRIVSSVTFTARDTGPEWRPDDELTHTPPPTAGRGPRKPRLVQRPKKGEK